MDFHTLTLDHHEFMQYMLDRNDLLHPQEPEKIYYIQAFIENKLQWDEYATNQEERDVLIKQAVEAGFSFVVETEIY
jgi:hypothetical protein